MAGTNNFLVWNPDKDNQLSDANWVSDSQRLGGAENPSIFTSERANKLFYQLTMMVAGFGEMLKAKGYPVSDADAPALIDTLASIVTVADFFSTDIGVADAFEVAIASPIGMPIYFIAAHSITGACTLTTTSVTTKAIKKEIDVALEEGDIIVGQMVGVVYDGTNFQMVGQGGGDMKPPRAIYNNCITGTVVQIKEPIGQEWGGGVVSLSSGALTANTYKELLSFTGSGVLQFCGLAGLPPGAGGHYLGLKIVLDGVTLIDVVSSALVWGGYGFAACGQLKPCKTDPANAGYPLADEDTFVRLEAWTFRKSLSIQVKSSLSETNSCALKYRLYLT